ncbi:hypothetical protein [Halalkalibacter krulwichiae]|uniref:Uncharacterized protein n=1 Tax=Halalkalibacter krulwichiae TaxID=199441 RepID=A0A1X9MJX7_9BACI|nr:hypothetical protein [Halalkalibacter krulwichiae]ARK31951.1 hypothetical protein BkAM31D_20065 [Halalkalibacter krulwichiae]
MNHNLDYDRDGDREDALSADVIASQLQSSLAREEEMMKTYLILSERIHDNAELKDRLVNFAEGNAKRSRQLMDELSKEL